MCTKLHIKVKSALPSGVKSAFVPCGRCEDCRNVMRSSWVFRLRYDLEKLTKKGWKIGFFTLTYNDESLPSIPSVFFKSDYEKIPCFRKSDLRTFFTKLKKWALNSYGCRRDKSTGEDTRLRYMCCSEFGEHTRRPHYHGIVCFPPNIPENEIFEKIHSIWTLGFVFPRCFNGGLDRHHYEHKPFIVESVKAAAVYAAKYCCKDIAYYDSIRDVELYKRVNLIPRQYHVKLGPILEDVDLINDAYDVISYGPCISWDVIDDPSRVVKLRLSDYMTFHYQSKSLGASFCEDLNDSQCLQALNSGYHFIGDDNLTPLPVYIKEKLFFTPNYVIDKHGKRLVRRKARRFLLDNAEEIFKAKVDGLKARFADFGSPEFWRSVGAEPSEYLFVTKHPVLDILSPEKLACHYLSYYGVKFNECYRLPFEFQWLRRYTDKIDVYNVPRISLDFYRMIHEFFFGALSLFNKYDYEFSKLKEKKQRTINKINDFFKSQE